MGLFGIDTQKSESYDQRMAATDQAIQIREGSMFAPTISAGGEGSAAISATHNAAAAAPGGVAIGAKAQVNTGLQLSNVKGNVILGDTEATVQAVSDTVKQLTESNTANLENALNAQSATLEKSLSKISELAQTKETGGAASPNVLYIILALFALLGAVFYFFKK